jgi:AcrR family transcriptional regulator
MGKPPRTSRKTRRDPLTREKVLEEALALADSSGLDAVSMRQVALGLGVEAMSLYRHVANKVDLLDGLVELIAGQWSVPSPDTSWQEALRTRAFSMRENLNRHPWAANLIEARSSTGPKLLRHHDSTIGILRKAGFSVELAFNTTVALNSYVYGFVLQEQAWYNPKPSPNLHAPMPNPADYPAIAEMRDFVMAKNRVLAESENPAAKRYFADFDFALDLLIEGIERTLQN